MVEMYSSNLLISLSVPTCISFDDISKGIIIFAKLPAITNPTVNRPEK